MISVAFLWHMHQPWYLDPDSGRFALPWVRLHGVKDYLDMGEILRDFPKIRITINVAPCLLEQLELYGRGTSDEHQLLCRKPAEELTPAEAARLMETGFVGIPEQIIHPYPRYYELMAKVGRKQPFSAQELRDLQVWSNLAWMDPRWRREIPLVGQLAAKGASFTEQEKQGLLQVQLDLLARIIPCYRQLQETGQLELSSSPWAHPILPLLQDTDTAQQTNPGMPLPSESFRFPEDVRWHLKTAADQFTRWFGRAPAGLWPSEGSVSWAVLPAVAEAGFRWLATDEEILWKSLALSKSGNSPRPSLYQPYRVTVADHSLTMLFRDHLLSDLIGFVYSGWPAEAAASNFLERLRGIEKTVPVGSAPPLVLVALDGENPWESYPEDGEPFLKALYGALSKENWIQCCTVSQYLEAYPAQHHLESVAAGSWIRGEFSTWIGHEPQNRAWEELVKARRLVGPQQSRAIAIAEGSDWFWWLGPEHSSPQDPVFDRIFRSYLKAAYRDAGQNPPAALEEPLKPRIQPVAAPIGPITPVLDGEVTSYFEWIHAGEIDLTHTGSAMARAKPVFSRFWWGSDAAALYFRLDPSGSLAEISGEISICEPRFQVKLSLDRGIVKGTFTPAREGQGQGPPRPLQVAAGKILEMALPFSWVALNPADAVKITISVEQEGFILERYPEHGQLTFALSSPFEVGQLWSA